MAVLVVLRHVNSPKGEPSETRDYTFHRTLAEWACRAHKGGGKVTLTSQEIHDLAMVYRDSCRENLKP